MGLIFIIIGIIISVFNSKIIEVLIENYHNDEDCKNQGIGKDCEIKFDIPEKLDNPIFLFYNLDNFY